MERVPTDPLVLSPPSFLEQLREKRVVAKKERLETEQKKIMEELVFSGLVNLYTKENQASITEAINYIKKDMIELAGKAMILTYCFNSNDYVTRSYGNFSMPLYDFPGWKKIRVSDHAFRIFVSRTIKNIVDAFREQNPEFDSSGQGCVSQSGSANTITIAWYE